MEREELNFALQKCPRGTINQLCNEIGNDETITIVRTPTPQTLLVPVHDPITNGVFYAGEVLVTSAIVQVNGVNGWAMVMDDDPELARLIATLDAAWAADVKKKAIHELALTGCRIQEQEEQTINQRVEATRVNFDLL